MRVRSRLFGASRACELQLRGADEQDVCDGELFRVRQCQEGAGRPHGLKPRRRTVIIRTKDGELRTVELGPNAQLSQLKVGDKVNATYYENIIIRKKPAGEADVDTLEASAKRGAGKAGGTIGLQQAITATITAVDMNVPSISLSGPRGWSYSSKVQDKKALEQVKIGDKVDITWTEAILVSVTAAKK